MRMSIVFCRSWASFIRLLVYTLLHRMVGFVKRKHRHLLDCARALRFLASLPIIFWGDCILTAAYLINRIPSLVLNGTSPFEILFNVLPEYDTLRVFGSLCYVTVPPKSKDKFAARAIKGIFLGYPYAR